MTISAEEYFKKLDNTKTVKLPSGVDFEIRKVQARELIGGPMPFSEKSDLKGVDEEDLQKKWQKMTPEKQKEQLEFTNFLIEKALISPKLTSEQIDNIPPEDYNTLIGEVTEFSFGKISNVSPTKGATT